MKNVIVLVLVLVLTCYVSSPLQAQWSTGGVLNTPTLTTGGSVGIGISAPLSGLHLNFSSSNVLRVQNPVGGLGNSAGIDFCTFSGTGKVARIEAIDMNGYNGDLVFSTDGDGVNNSNVTERMRISNNGNVGIGNNNPQTKLDVSGDIRAATRYQFTTANAYTNASYAVIGLASGSPGKNIVFYNYDGPINELMTINGTTGTTAINNGGLTVSGNVGIGTLIPDQKLTVKGVVHASEVQIDLNVPGPDYVFEKAYTLPKLEEVKSYVDANKHLPEVPSAKEMEKNGIQVGEMNMILLKKVEELTLYLIEANKRMDEQQMENLLQQKEIEVLKEIVKKK